jgi:hypothetical protein
MRCIRLCECVTSSRLKHVSHLHEISSPHTSQFIIGINLVPHTRHDSLLNKPSPYSIKNNCPTHRKDSNFRHIMGRILWRGRESSLFQLIVWSIINQSQLDMATRVFWKKCKDLMLYKKFRKTNENFQTGVIYHVVYTLTCNS